MRRTFRALFLLLLSACGLTDPDSYSVLLKVEDPNRLGGSASLLQLYSESGDNLAEKSLSGHDFPLTLSLSAHKTTKYFVKVEALTKASVVGRGVVSVSFRSGATETFSVELKRPCESAADCDDGVYCNGSESCDANHTCTQGEEPCPPSAISCVDVACVEELGTCDIKPTNSLCGPNQYCSPLAGCLGGQPCEVSVDCADGVACNGNELCDSNRCIAGTQPSVSDNSPCTFDLCVEPGGPSNPPNTGANGFSCVGQGAQESICLNGNCVAASCGDGLITASVGEMCDDGNSSSLDGCSSTCVIEPGWTCSGVPTTCNEICGDTFVVGSEACDEGINSDPCDGCNADCTQVPNFGCGDGFACALEQCDLGTSGNTGAYDGCNPNCTLGPRCGDGGIDASNGEECDDGPDNGNRLVSTCGVDCLTLLSVGGTVSGVQGHGTLTLILNGVESLPVTAEGAFTFNTLLAPGESYTVSLGTMPASGTCRVTGAAGVVGTSNIVSVGATCMARVTQVSAGSGHTCVVTEAGALKCWGVGTAGALGRGDVVSIGDNPGEMGAALASLDLGAGFVAASVDAGISQSCAVSTAGTLKCWGVNTMGSLGLGDTLARGDQSNEMGSSLPPVDVALGDFINAGRVTLGDYFACVELTNGGLRCFGSNAYAQLGLGDAQARGDQPGEMGSALPLVSVGTGRTVVEAAAGFRHTCALLDNGAVKCWGDSELGQLGGDTEALRGDAAGEMGDSLPTINLGTGRTARHIAAGWGHTCAILDNFKVKCWGSNGVGQLGLGDNVDRGYLPSEMGDTLPYVNLGTGRTAVAIGAGQYSSCAILDNGALKCWGNNSVGELGLGDNQNRGDGPGEMGDALPSVSLGAGRTALKISVGGYATCALLDDATVKCWGVGTGGRLGQGNTNTIGDGAGEMGDALAPVNVGW